MSIVLAIDTSSSKSSLAILSSHGKLLSWDGVSGSSHNEELALALERLLKEAGAGAKEISRIIYGNGPGSFTGLRIGLSLVKGIAQVHEIPVSSVSSLRCMAAAGPSELQVIGAYADARRDEVFFGLYTKRSGKLESLGDDTIVKVADVPVLLKEATRQTSAHEASVGLVCADELPALASCGVRHTKVGTLAAALLCLDAEPGAARPGYSLPELSSLEPHYLRRVAAKSIAERAAEAPHKQ